MLKIRLKRVGRKHDTSFRVIVTPSGSSITSGKYVDQIGFYDPRTNKKEIDKDKATKWLSDGAKPTDTVFNLLVDVGVIEAQKKNVLPQKSPVGVEGQDLNDGSAADTADQADSENDANAEDQAEIEAPEPEAEKAEAKADQEESAEETKE